ncbi:hypothetical protein EDB85DRAFT_1942156 [Lactarius pseudohatsudake]|nr:hypothetical protein EDB85DRAFT_1942156 [Lactarius pseudohatsudake]
MRQISHGPPIRRRERSGASELSQIDHPILITHHPPAPSSQSISLVDVLLDLVTHKTYHIEGRPSEGGRAVIVDTIATKTFSAPSGMPLQSYSKVQNRGPLA